MYGYIYKTTNLVTGKIYIGQHRANEFDESYIGSGTRLLNLIRKYGMDQFRCEMLEPCDSESELNERECYWIAKLNSTDRSIGYNLMSGGYRTRGMRHSTTTKAKISRTKTGCHPNRVYGPVPAEVRARISTTLKSYYKTHPNPRKGIKVSEETKAKLRAANLGKTWSETTRSKCAGRVAWNKGVPMSEDAKQHLHDVNTGKVIKRRTVGQYSESGELIATYISCADASRKTGFGRSHITSCCLHRQHTAYGYRWEYLD